MEQQQSNEALGLVECKALVAMIEAADARKVSVMFYDALKPEGDSAFFGQVSSGLWTVIRASASLVTSQQAHRIVCFGAGRFRPRRIRLTINDSLSGSNTATFFPMTRMKAVSIFGRSR